MRRPSYARSMAEQALPAAAHLPASPAPYGHLELCSRWLGRIKGGGWAERPATGRIERLHGKAVAVRRHQWQPHVRRRRALVHRRERPAGRGVGHEDEPSRVEGRYVRPYAIAADEVVAIKLGCGPGEVDNGTVRGGGCNMWRTWSERYARHADGGALPDGLIGHVGKHAEAVAHARVQALDLQ